MSYGTFNAFTSKISQSVCCLRSHHARKWLTLALLSLLTGINQGICYSYAPIATLSERRWHDKLHSTELVTIYFVSYIPCSFWGSWIMDRKGLRCGVLLGASLQAVGSSLRYIGSRYSITTELALTIAGQILASIAMPFMVNSPPVLSSNWFPPSLRATATSIAVNANAMGIAVVYLTAPLLVHSIQDIPQWNAGIAVAAIITWLAAYIGFASFPPQPNSRAKSMDRHKITTRRESDVHLQDEYDWRQWGNAFAHNGFWITVLVFSVSECILNAMSALLAKFLCTEGFTKSEIGTIGAVFITSSMVGGQIISRFVDRLQNHSQALQLCIIITAIGLVVFKFTLRAVNGVMTLLTLICVGAALGPIQPLVLELGVECAHPTSEATVAALQQLCGNILSAILVPAISILRRKHSDSDGRVPYYYAYACPEWILVFLLFVTSIAFLFLYVLRVHRPGKALMFSVAKENTSEHSMRVFVKTSK